MEALDILMALATLDASDWAILAVACLVIVALWLEAEERIYPSDDDTNEVDRMIDLGQQPGSWEP